MSFDKGQSLPADLETLLERCFDSLQKGDLEVARQGYLLILAQWPDQTDAIYFLGVIAFQQGDLAQAEKFISEAVQADNTDAMRWLSLGAVYDARGELNNAAHAYRSALEVEPTLADAAYNLAITLEQNGEEIEAEATYQRFLNLEPNDAIAWCNYGALLKKMNRLSDAGQAYRKSIELAPHFGEAHFNLGNILELAHRYEEAIAAFRTSLQYAPDLVVAEFHLANLLRQSGQIEESIQHYERAISIDPSFADAYRSLAFTRRFRKADTLVETMEQMFASENTSSENRMYLGFGLGKVFEDIGDYNRMFEYLFEANKLKRSSYDYDIAWDRAFCADLKKEFNDQYFSNLSADGNEDSAPIFVFGMPRSGTTLVEQILSSHSMVYGAGETSILPDLVANYSTNRNLRMFAGEFTKFSADKRREIGRSFLTIIGTYARGSERIVDKTTHNFWYVGYIKAILPNAKLVHCRRDPRATCTSIYKNFFASGNFFAYDQIELGQYYRLYEDLMDHWRSIFGNAFFEIEYEKLIANQKAETASLLGYCGLPWEESCLQFYETKRVVRTASAVQVRNQIYSGSVDQWQRYEKPLAPLFQQLDEAKP